MGFQTELAESVQRNAWTGFVQQTQHEFENNWLRLTVNRVQAEGGALFTAKDQAEPFAQVGVFTRLDLATLNHTAQQAWDSAQGMVLDAGQQRYHLVCPAAWGGHVFGLLVVQVQAGAASELGEIMQELQWAVGWLIPGQQADALKNIESKQALSANAITLMAEVLSERKLDLGIRALLSRMSSMFDADRVSFGFARGRRVKVDFVSDMAKPKKRREAVSMIEAAMAESFDQNNVISAPSDEDQLLITRAHQALMESQGSKAAITVPLRVEEGAKIIGLLTLERDQAKPFDALESELLEAAGIVLGPAVDFRRRAERAIVIIAMQRINLFLGGMFSWRGMKWGAIAALLTFVVYAGFWYQVPYKVRSDAVLVSEQTQLISAPFEGFISEIGPREGDRVSQGDLLLALNTDELDLELLRIDSEIRRLERQRQEAEGQFDRAQERQLKAEIEVKRIERETIERRIERSVVRAPYPALVTEGDLSQRIGGAVAPGDALLSIAPADRFRVELSVDEPRIADVELGQKGELLLASLPDYSWQVQIKRIVPGTQYNDGQSFFLVEADLLGQTDLLLPGMQGVAKLNVEPRSFWAVITQDLLDWLRIRIWSFWG